jgi:serine/threonine protein kinase
MLTPRPIGADMAIAPTAAMHYCHSQGYVHRDLKAENILLDGQMNIKIADFGFANEFNKGQSLQTYCGSPFYASPEIYRNVPYTGPEVDMWALGCLLYIMVTSHMPFENLRRYVATLHVHFNQDWQPQPPFGTGKEKERGPVACASHIRWAVPTQHCAGPVPDALVGQPHVRGGDPQDAMCSSGPAGVSGRDAQGPLGQRGRLRSDAALQRACRVCACVPLPGTGARPPTPPAVCGV